MPLASLLANSDCRLFLLYSLFSFLRDMRRRCTSVSAHLFPWLELPSLRDVELKFLKKGPLASTLARNSTPLRELRKTPRGVAGGRGISGARNRDTTTKNRPAKQLWNPCLYLAWLLRHNRQHQRARMLAVVQDRIGRLHEIGAIGGALAVIQIAIEARKVARLILRAGCGGPSETHCSWTRDRSCTRRPGPA